MKAAEPLSTSSVVFQLPSPIVSTERHHGGTNTPTTQGFAKRSICNCHFAGFMDPLHRKHTRRNRGPDWPTQCDAMLYSILLGVIYKTALWRKLPCFTCVLGKAFQYPSFTFVIAALYKNAAVQEREEGGGGGDPAGSRESQEITRCG